MRKRIRVCLCVLLTSLLIRECVRVHVLCTECTYIYIHAYVVEIYAALRCIHTIQ